jgi:methyl-accepting chemotaxis protein
MRSQGISIRLKLYVLTGGAVGGTLLTIAVFLILMGHSTGSFSAAMDKTVGEDTRLFELINHVAAAQGLLQQINREQDLEKIEALATGYEGTVGAADKLVLADFPDPASSPRQVWSKLKNGNQSILDLVLKGQQAMALQKIASDSNPLFEKLLDEIDSHRKQTTQEQAALLAGVSRNVHATLIIFVAAILLAYAGFTVFGLFISRGITKNIGRTLEMLKLIAEGKGDLTRRLPVESRDEMGELAFWFNKFVENLDEVISLVKKTADGMDTSTREVASGSLGLSQATQEQASAIEEVAATIEEMTSSIKLNAENASEGHRKSTDMVAKASASGEAAQELVRAMSEISTASKKVGDIITTVNEVAFQTNLLALNAAVEAARAGEHGKGFAVVAEEVRALAQRSASASKQIKTLVEDTVNKVTAGDSIVQRTGESLGQIITSIQELSQLMEEIAACSGEQASGIDELNRAVSQIDNTTQQNAATVEELASTSDNLSSEAKDLAGTVARFTVSRDVQAPVKQMPVKKVIPAAVSPVPKKAVIGQPRLPVEHSRASIDEEGFEEF